MNFSAKLLGGGAPAGSAGALVASIGEIRRRKIVKLIFVLYWLLIFEGALRKWVFPGLSDVLLFVRDPFLLYLYYRSIRFGPRPSGPLLLIVGILFLLFYALATLQFTLSGNSAFAYVYGLRNYFFYLPLIFICEKVLDRKDIEALVFRSLLVGTLIAPLIIVQFISPPSAWINRSTTGNEGVFLVGDGVVRAYGTFSFTSGQALFASTIFSFALILISQNWRYYKIGLPLRAIFISAAFILIFLSGARKVFAYCGFTVLIYYAIQLIASRQTVQKKLRKVLISISAMVLGIAVVSVAFPQAQQLLADRQENAVRSEGATEDRIFRMLTQAIDVMPETPLLGFGIGFGSKVGSFLNSGTTKGFALAENELPRLVQEGGPIFGTLYILFRFTLVVYILKGAILSVRRSEYYVPSILAGVTCALLVTGQATLQNTINGFTWLFTGFTLAAIHVGTRRK